MSEVLKPGERYAGFWIRFVASVIDSIIVSLVIGPIAGALYKKPDATGTLIAAAQSGDLTGLALALADAMRPAGVGDFLLNAGLPAVAVVTFWIYRSATPGKMATRTRIVDATTGGTPSTKQCIVRYLGYLSRSSDSSWDSSGSASIGGSRAGTTSSPGRWWCVTRRNRE